MIIKYTYKDVIPENISEQTARDCLLNFLHNSDADINEMDEELQIHAILQKYQRFSFIINPSDKVKLAMLCRYGYGINLIHEPTEEMCQVAVMNIRQAIRFIKNPSIEVQRIAINEDPSSIRFIKNPPEEIQMQAIQMDSKVIVWIDNPAENVLVLAKFSN